MTEQGRNNIHATLDHLDRAAAIVEQIIGAELPRKEQKPFADLIVSIAAARVAAVELLRAADVDTLNVLACNTDCLAYARGTCGYIDAARLSKPADAYGLKDIRTCPRYREQYPERV